MELHRRQPSPSFLMLVLSMVCISSMVMQGVKASCTVQNKSGKKVTIEPVEVHVTIEVDVDVTVQVPPTQQHCYFKNADTGHKQGPVTLVDGTIYVIVDGAVSGTVDVCVASLVLGILQLGAKICVSL